MDETETKHIEHKAYWKGLQVLFCIFIIGYGILYGLSMLDLSFLKGEIVSYQLECDVKPEYNVCPPGKTLFALRAHHYKPNKDRQEVLSWIEGFPPDRLTDCAVVDRENWKCSFDDKSSTFGFENGSYFSYSAEDKPYFKEYSVSRQTWLKEDCEDSIFSMWYCIPLHGMLRGG